MSDPPSLYRVEFGNIHPFPLDGSRRGPIGNFSAQGKKLRELVKNQSPSVRVNFEFPDVGQNRINYDANLVFDFLKLLKNPEVSLANLLSKVNDAFKNLGFSTHSSEGITLAFVSYGGNKKYPLYEPREYSSLNLPTSFDMGELSKRLWESFSYSLSLHKKKTNEQIASYKTELKRVNHLLKV